MLSSEEIQRYSRQILLPELGTAGQERLKQARVLVIGAGGLGSPVLLYLAAAGVGKLGIVDDDTVDVSNLQRQVLYRQQDVGASKAVRAAEVVRELNPDVNVIPINEAIRADNALGILQGYDLVIDGSDNLPTRYLVNDACVLKGLPLIYGAIFRFEGQVTVFNELINGTRGPNYRDLFPEPPPPEMVPSCAEAGVLGVLPGIIGSLQASEAIKVITGMGTTLTGRLLIMDTLDFSTRYLRIHSRSDNPISGNAPTIRQLIDYEAFCQPFRNGLPAVELVSPEEVSRMLTTSIPFQFIDVREPMEYQIDNLGALNIPLSSLSENIHKISREIPVVLHCRGGQRSRSAAERLMAEHQFVKVRSMDGGILAWRQKFGARRI